MCSLDNGCHYIQFWTPNHIKLFDRDKTAQFRRLINGEKMFQLPLKARVLRSEYMPYATKKSCTWTISAPYAYKLTISYPEIDLPKTIDCTTARLTIGTQRLCNEATYQMSNADAKIFINFVSSWLT